MSLSAAVIDAMVAAGCTAEQLASAIKTANAEADALLAAKRAKAAEKKRRQRALVPGTNRDIAGQEGTEGDKVSPKKETSPTPPKEKTTPSSTEPNGSSKTRASRLPADWVLPIDWRQDAIKAGLPGDRIDLEAEKMRDWSLSSPSGAKLNWRAAWRNWSKGAAEKIPKRGQAPPKTAQPRGSDHFTNYAEELENGRAGNSRSHQGNWDDAEGVPIIAIEHYRRNA